MEAQLISEGFDGAAIVMLGGPGGGQTSQPASFSWSRFSMSDNLGNWVGELFHQVDLCGIPAGFDFAGAYPTGVNMGPFEAEAGFEATHPCAWTKRAVGWLDPSAVAQHPGGIVDYLLQAASLIQPPPTGRTAAIQIGAAVPYLMVEARLQADQFDINIPNEGVIVYRVQTTDPLGWAQNNTAPLALITKTALGVGQSTTTDGVTIKVIGALSLGGGFTVQVGLSTPEARVPNVLELAASAASRIIEDAGFLPNFVVEHGGSKGVLFVASQSPPAGSFAAPGSTVNMTLRGGPLE